MRLETATNLHQLQQRLGTDFSLGAEPEPTFQPVVRQALRLHQIAGPHSGGSMVLESGSYRFGERSGAPMFAVAEPTTPRFGLTIDPGGAVIAHPSGAGMAIDGRRFTSPAALSVGQVINVGSAQFLLDSPSTIIRRGQDDLEETGAFPPMPAPGRGRGIDHAIVGWVHEQRKREANRLRAGVFRPDQFGTCSRSRAEALFSTVPGEPNFGHASIALGDVIGSVIDLSTANSASRQAADELALVPSVPLLVDLTQQSLAIVGPRDLSRAIASWVVLGQVAMSRPADLQVQINAEGNFGEWTWTDPLPHTTSQPTQQLKIMVFDTAQPVAAAPAHGAVVLVNPGERVPPTCNAILHTDPAATRLTLGGTDVHHGSATPVGVSALFALEAVFQMGEHLRTAGVAR